MDELQRFLEITKRINKGLDPSLDDLKFYASFAGSIDDARLSQLNSELEKLKKDGKIDPEMSTEAVGLAVQKMQTEPLYREKLLKIQEQAQAGKLSNEIASGLNVLLAGADVAASAQQIAQSKQSLKNARKPGKPAIPPRDQYLAQALRGAQEGNYGVSQTIAPVRAEIQDNYLADLQNARTAATGQAGAYGSYAQAASNRRNQAALGLGALSQRVRQQNQANYNELLGQRLGETQRMFDNQAQFYPTDLNQYNNEVQAAGALGAQGRMNMRDSLANLGQFGSQQAGSIVTSRRFRNLYNSLKNIAPNSADKVMDSINFNYYNTPGYESSYIG